jgi:hypothetical protein
MPTTPIPPDKEPISYFELQRNRDGLPEPGDAMPAPVMPALPPTSPWSTENMIPDELPVDRREDGDFFQPEDFFQPTTEGDQ